MGDKIYTFGILLAVLFLARQIVSYVSAARFKRKHGCKSPPRIPQFENIIGFEMFRVQAAAAKNKRILQTAKDRFDTYGNTWDITVMGKKFINTIEPENIKTILATNFKDYGLGGRLAAFSPLLGEGIFTTGTDVPISCKTLKLMFQ